MLLNIEQRNVETTGLQKVARATIKATAKVFDFFGNKTYTQKFHAVVRELVANAIDAHVMAGNPEPVVVTLPTEDNPYYSVKDQGIGMSEDFVLGPYLAYTDGSTKTDTNNQIGGLGIGSKSPLALVDQYLLRSVHDGTATIYSIFKDEEGIPSGGILDQRPTDERNGVEVMVPAELSHFDSYKRAAEEVLGYFDPKPTVIGTVVPDPAYVARGEGWAIRPTAGPLGVVMGGIRYPVENHHLPWDVRSTELTSYGVDLFMPIGSCQVALSREALSLDETTLAAIKAALLASKDAIIETFSSMFDNQPSLWYAKVALYNEVRAGSIRGQFLRQHARYRGEPLTEHMSDYCWVITRGRRHRTTIPRPEFRYGNHFTPGKIHRIVLDDGAPRLVARLTEAYQSDFLQERQILVVQDAAGYPDVVRASSLPLPAPVPRERQVGRDVAFYRNGTERITDFGAATIAVVMTGFTIPARVRERMWDGMIQSNEVIFVNKVDARHVTGFRDFMEVWNERKQAYIAEHGKAAAAAKALREDPHLKRIFRYFYGHLPELTPAQQARPFGKLVKLYEQSRQYHSVPTFIEPKLPARLNTEQLVAQFEEQQWQVAHLLSNLNLSNETSRKLIKCLA